MKFLSVPSLYKKLALIGTLLFCTTALAFVLQDAKDKVLRNGSEIQYGWEIHQELDLAPEVRTAIKDYFPSFLEYQDLVMFHPKVGYYASGRVSFTNDYQTYPIVLAPRFGQMIAEQMFFMWDGMRKAGTLGEKEQFTIAEFGAGDGVMAESVLDYLEQRSKADRRWRDFANQVLYICYDRSPALNNTQRERNARFGSRFEARLADATNLTATIPPGSLKGVVLSNELPDAFSVHKIILSANGTAEVAFVVPALPLKNWEAVRPLLPAQVAKAIEEDHLTVEKKFFSGIVHSHIYLTRSSFVALLENLLPTGEYEATANALQFQEAYVPAATIPEVAAHLRRYAPVYGAALAKNSRGLVAYINLGAESLIQGSAQVLKSGYMLTIDYGSTWDFILGDDSYSHFRAYGPAHREGYQQDGVANAGEAEIYNPYAGPTLNDMTTDVNFSLLAAEGQLVGLKPMYYGSQGALQSGTGVSLKNAPANRHEKYDAWAAEFDQSSVYKVLVQQKEGTDKAYRFPDKTPESLGLDQSKLTATERLRAAEVEKVLSGAPTSVAAPQR